MLRCYLNLALLTLALSASLVQEAVIAMYRVDQVGYPANGIVFSQDYALADKRVFVPKMELPSLQYSFDPNDVNALQMHLMQLNLSKILIIMDVIILICVFYSMNSD